MRTLPQTPCAVNSAPTTPLASLASVNATPEAPPVRHSLRLTLTITTSFGPSGRTRSDSYRVSPDRGKSVFAAVRSFWLRKTSGGPAYHVSHTLAGNVCNCPSFRYLREINAPSCKHVRALVAAGLLDADTTRPRLAQTAGLTLADMADREAEAYGALGTPEGAMFARTMAELASLIRSTKATTPEELEARLEVLEADVRERWEARGFEQGQRAGCGCGEYHPA